MLLIYLQEYEKDQLKRMVLICRNDIPMDWETRVAGYALTPEELLKKVEQSDIPAVFLMDDSPPESLHEAVSRIRELSRSHYLVLSLCSPEDALKIRPPFYRPSGFLLRPVEQTSLLQLMDSIYHDFIASSTKHDEIFSVKIRGTVYPIPYDRILCFESMDKKILARTKAQEYEFYGSLEEICKNAPPFFLRIHKSACVNLQEIRSVNFKERMVTLSDESFLPFSRTFKAELAKALELV